MLNDQSDTDIYVNAAIKAFENDYEARARLCIEKAVFSMVIGGKEQKKKDQLFGKYHQRDKSTMDDF